MADTTPTSTPTPHPSIAEDNRQLWKRMYPRWNEANLETEGIVRESDDAYLVQDGHPILHLLAGNADVIGVNVLELPPVRGNHRRISSELFKTCAATLRRTVFNNQVHHADDDAGSGAGNRPS